MNYIHTMKNKALSLAALLLFVCATIAPLTTWAQQVNPPGKSKRELVLGWEENTPKKEDADKPKARKKAPVDVVKGKDGLIKGTVSVTVLYGEPEDVPSSGLPGKLEFCEDVDSSKTPEFSYDASSLPFPVTIKKWGTHEVIGTYTYPGGTVTTVLPIGRPCESCAECVSGKVVSSNDSVNSFINLGKTIYGFRTGSVRIYTETPNPELAQITNLREAISPDAEVIRDAVTNGLRQIYSEELIDFNQMDEFKYEIKFYRPSAIGAKVDGFYTTTGAAFRTITVENSAQNPVAGEDVKKLKVTNAFTYNGSTRTDVSEYTWSDADNNWILAEGAGANIRVTRLVNTYQDEFCIETRTIEDGQGNVAYKSQTWYDETNDNQKVKEIVDPDGAALTTTYSYYDDSQLKEVVYPDGSWVRYVYPGGLDKITITSYENTPVNSPENMCKVLEERESKETVDGTVITTKTTIIRIKGIEVGRSYTRYVGDFETQSIKAASQGAAWDDAANQVTITKLYDSGEFIRRTKSVERHDGTMTIHSYSRANNILATTIKRGVPDATKTDIVDGTMSITQENSKGTTVSSETFDIASGIKIAGYNVTLTDEHGRATRTDYYNGIYTTRKYGCCGIEEETNTAGIVTTHAYDELHRKSHTVRNGITTFYTYDAKGRTLSTRVKGTDGTEIVTSTNVYDKSGRLVSTTDMAGLVISYAYNGLVDTVTYPGGATSVTTRNLDGSIYSTTGTAAAAVYYTSGVNGADGSLWNQVNQGSESGARWSKSTRNFLGQTIETESPTVVLGVTRLNKSYYNPIGQLVRSEVVDSNGDKLIADTRYEYNAKGEVTRSGQDIGDNDSLDNASKDRISETSYSYITEDGFDWRVDTRTGYIKDNNDGTATTLGTTKTRLSGFFNGLASETKSIDLLGNVTTFTTTIDRATSTVAQAVDSPFSNVNSVAVSVDGLLQSQTSAQNVTTTFGYDDFNRRITVTDPHSGTSTTAYNVKGQVTSVTDAAGSVTSFEYDATTGRNVKVIDPKLAETTVQYDIRGRKISVTDRLGATTPYTYDDFNQLTKITDALGKDTIYTYDDLGFKTSTQYPDHVDGTSAGQTGYGIVSYSYDSVGRLQTITHQDGSRVTASFDTMTSAILTRTYSDATSDTFTYNRLGRTLTATKGRYNNSVAYSYNSDGQLTSESLTVDGTTGTTGYGYDTLGRPNSITYPDGKVMDKAFTTTSIPAAITFDGVSVVSYGYDANARESSRSLGNGLVVNRTYEPTLGRLASIDTIHATSGVLAELSFAYTYDVNHNVLSETTGGVMAGKSWDAGFDAADRLSSQNRTGGATKFWNLDSIGNWTSVTTDGTTETRTHGDAHQLTSTDTGKSYTYNLQGNVTSLPVNESSVTLAWDQENYLTEAKDDQDNTLGTYEYDAMGRRVAKTVSGIKTVYAYSGNRVVAEYKGEHWSSSTLVDKTYVYGNYIDEPLMQIDAAGAKVYFHQDRQFNVRGLTDASGTILELSSYDAYGKRSLFDNLGASLSSSATAYGYTGRRLDSETGLWYFRARYYSEDMGRFISRDPLGYVDGMGLYNGYFARQFALDPLGFEILYYFTPGAYKDTLPGDPSSKYHNAQISIFNNMLKEVKELNEKVGKHNKELKILFPRNPSSFKKNGSIKKNKVGMGKKDFNPKFNKWKLTEMFDTPEEIAKDIDFRLSAQGNDKCADKNHIIIYAHGIPYKRLKQNNISLDVNDQIRMDIVTSPGMNEIYKIINKHGERIETFTLHVCNVGPETLEGISNKIPQIKVFGVNKYEDAQYKVSRLPGNERYTHIHGPKDGSTNKTDYSKGHQAFHYDPTQDRLVGYKGGQLIPKKSTKKSTSLDDY